MKFTRMPIILRHFQLPGALLVEQGKFADAEGLIKRLLAIEYKTLGSDNTAAATTLTNFEPLLVKQVSVCYVKPPQHWFLITSSSCCAVVRVP